MGNILKSMSRKNKASKIESKESFGSVVSDKHVPSTEGPINISRDSPESPIEDSSVDEEIVIPSSNKCCENEVCDVLDIECCDTDCCETKDCCETEECCVEEKCCNIQVEEAPVEEAPVEEAPVEEAPVEEAPVEEAPVEEVPVEENPDESN